MKTPLTFGLMVLGLGAMTSCGLARQPLQPAAHPAGEAPAVQPALDWKALESPVLTGHIELTSRDQFVKAGEAYFSPDNGWIIFQAVPVPRDGANADPFYSMYVAKVVRGENGAVTGIQTPILVSPPGSANTCGWFHPTLPGVVLFGSTIQAPHTDQKAGFRVGDRKYVWLFPEETEVCERFVPQMAGPAVAAAWADDHRTLAPTAVFSRPDYDAECSYSPDGRFILYAHVRAEKTAGRADADIWVYDTLMQRHHPLVVADGYDGGPFFSPDGRRICYRSDRGLNDLLQLYVADLKFDSAGVPVGIEREYQITDNKDVNWAPYWHPSGKFLVYGTSEVSHANYEVFAVEIDNAKLAADAPGSRASDTLRRTRITSANGADVLPVFSSDGSMMMWTCQRGPMAEGEQRPSSQLWVATFNAAAVKFDQPAK